MMKSHLSCQFISRKQQDFIWYSMAKLYHVSPTSASYHSHNTCCVILYRILVFSIVVHHHTFSKCRLISLFNYKNGMFMSMRCSKNVHRDIVTLFAVVSYTCNVCIHASRRYLYHYAEAPQRYFYLTEISCIKIELRSWKTDCVQMNYMTLLLMHVLTWENDIPWWRHQMETFSALLAICAGNSPVPFPHKGQWRGALIFSLICVRINGFNNGEAGDLRRYLAHYDVTVRGYKAISIFFQ